MAKNHDAVEMRAADSDSSLDGTQGTSEDAKDMYRLGRSQQLKVCFKSYFSDGLVVVLTLWPTEKFPLDTNSRTDVCYHVYMDGHLVVSTLDWDTTSMRLMIL